MLYSGSVSYTHLFSELVVATTATDGVLAAHARINLDLKHRARVIVQATNQTGILDIRNTRSIQIALYCLEMCIRDRRNTVQAVVSK